MKTRFQSLITTLVFISFSFLPTVEAVNPPPDGGYPGANTAAGQNALFSLSSGLYNTAIGYFSLEANQTGNSIPGLAREHFSPTSEIKTQRSARGHF